MAAAGFHESRDFPAIPPLLSEQEAGLAAGQRLSYVKATAMTLAGSAGSLAMLVLQRKFLPGWGMLAAVLLIPDFLVCSLIALGGMLVLYRDTLERQGRKDLFLPLFNRVSRTSARGWRKWGRPLLGAAPRPGDLVRVRSAADILATLDESGKLAGLPFMPEMLDYCGRVFTVDRRIDKINDWMAGNKLRRLQKVVTLLDQRCDGARHGACQAACQLLWKDDWLCRVRPRRPAPAAAAADLESLRSRLLAAAARQVERDGRQVMRYTCQITELIRASSPMPKWDIRQDLRPLLNGSIGIAGFLVAKLTAAFNLFQRLHGGVRFPDTGPQLKSPPTPIESLDLRSGELVRVRNKYEIGRTLHKDHNRGMWFGGETLRHCNQCYRVQARVERIIHERSGEMIEMTTPTVALESVTATGEYLRFCPQNEYVFWREIWLRRIDAAPPASH